MSGDEKGVEHDAILVVDESVSPAEVASFVRRVVPEVYRYVIRLTGGDAALAEDLVQEACLAVVREVRAKDAFRVETGWMIVVARRRYLDHLRRQRRERDRLERLVTPGPGAVVDVDDGSSGPPDVLSLLGALDDDHRAALVLHYVDDLAIAEVAKQLDRTPSATKSLLARARHHLAQLIEEAEHAGDE